MYNACLANEKVYGDRFRQLKEDEKKKKSTKALPTDKVEISASTSDSEDEADDETKPKVNIKVFFVHLISTVKVHLTHVCIIKNQLLVRR